MNAKKTDISQIRKYLNGELDARAMHKLEREAQDDPFLMDALEGYTGKKDQQANLDELQKRLNHRIGRVNKKIVPLWPLISIAATVLVMLGVGTWWLIVYQPAANKTLPTAADKTVVAMVPVPPQQPKSAPAIQAPVPQHHEVIKSAPVMSMADVAPVVASEGDANAEVRIDEPVAKSDVKAIVGDSLAKGSVLNEVVVTGYISQKKKDVAAAVAAIRPIAIDTQLQSRVAGVNVKMPTARDRMYTQLITGRVISSDDQKPLPGVNVTVLGNSKKGAVTDANGLFKMEVSKNDNLKLGYVGYESKQVKATGDSLNIALNPSQQSLAEVVVTSYGTKDVIEEAHPRNGWDSFRKYLADALSPDGKTGKVRIRFIVNADNTLSDFKVTKSLSSDADAEAIRLIKEGQAWIHNVNGEPETVTVVVKFK